MKLIAPKYWQLHPRAEYLNDEVVMAQAWKKTHGYIRTHNWYADTLALDVSALSLESLVKRWASTISSTKSQLRPMELVPAAKHDPWIVDSDKGWIPERTTGKDAEEEISKVPLRPLAHLSVRDQTWATAAMLCLADIVETAQGDCSGIDVFAHQRRRVYSYGNRLLCDWKEDGSAWFRWGNSQIYRKFFTDYQSFLRRPVVIGREAASNHASPEVVYVISLDLSKFYDNIDRQKLISKLRKVCKQADAKDCPVFWETVKKITNWRWRPNDIQKATDLGIPLVDGRGIPQGLVAAGFFANAYMLDFDHAVGNQIGSQIAGCEGIYLHDYCRYVDDIRLVVSLDKSERYSAVTSQIVRWLNEHLKKHAGSNFEFNSDKTTVTSLGDLDNKGSLSERVAQIQNELSGPADRDVLDSTMGALEGLLSTTSDKLPDLESLANDFELIKIAKFDHNIRVDTLKRFAANRLETIMRNKRKIDNSVGIETAKEIDNQSELLAKKLIWAWIQDPSLALLLRKALEIFPSAQLGEPVFDAIYIRCGFSEKKEVDSVTTAMAIYLLADLFRTCIDLHSYFQRVEYPSNSDPDQLLDLACRYAQKVASQKTAPLFLRRQALLLLAVMQKPVLLSGATSSIQEYLHEILSGRKVIWKRQILALYEVAAQITGNSDSIAMLFLEAVEQASAKEQSQALDDLAKRGGGFWLSVWSRLQKSNVDSTIINDLEWAAPIRISQIKTKTARLDMLISTSDKPFSHEAALIKLALRLIHNIEKTDFVPVSPSNLLVSKKLANQTWSKLFQPDVDISTVEYMSDPIPDPRYVVPKWILDDEDCETIYWIGSILRAAVVGSVDFTGNRWKSGIVQSYKGLRTGWYKRRMGMMHAPEALVGEFSTISGWFAELLMKCLQWPGFESTYLTHEDIAKFDSVDSLKSVLIDRLALLNKLYCKAIETPALVTRVNRPKHRHEKGFRLVSVQQLLPRTKDFSKADPMLNSPATRALNRDHLARVCLLTCRTLDAILAAEGKESYPGADLIVFPELAVHPDDQDLIKRLADKTQSMVFAGLGFQEHEGKLINIARWFIPDYRDTGRQWVIRDQGKQHPMKEEVPLGVVGYRPCQHIIEVHGDLEGPFYISGAVCFDATDLKLASDLKGKTDLFIVAAHNKDVRTFDNMTAALNYHMYQHIVVVNKGEFGGSTIQAPYREQYDRLISHAHGIDQISINVADLDLAAFKRKSKTYKKVKTPPAN